MSTRTAQPTKAVRRAKRKKPRKTYRQNWTLYNLARAREPKDFMHLLAEITRMIPEEMSFQKENGRPRLLLAAVAYAMIFLRYFKLPQRAMGSTRDEGLLLELYQNGFIPQCLHWNSIGHHFRDSRMTEVLEFLVELSALPLVAVERGDFETHTLPVVDPYPTSGNVRSGRHLDRFLCGRRGCSHKEKEERLSRAARASGH